MKIIITHKAADLDAIASTWIIKRFLPGWENSEFGFVPAGEKLKGAYTRTGDVIEKVDGMDAIHVDTGLGPLDHHQVSDVNICATSLAFDYVLAHNEALARDENKKEAIRRIVEYAIDDDHFQEVFYQRPESSVYDFTVVSLIHGTKLRYPKDEQTVMAFGMDCLDSAFHYLENRVWAEREIREKGIEFHTRFGKSIAVETLNDAVLKLAQLMGYVIAVRKDPSTSSVRIKARPARRRRKSETKDIKIDLTPVYEKLKKMDPHATWFFHISRRMILNGSTKNPKMKGSKLTLSEVVEILQNI